jgi:hypothetical protein
MIVFTILIILITNNLLDFIHLTIHNRIYIYKNFPIILFSRTFADLFHLYLYLIDIR